MAEVILPHDDLMERAVLGAILAGHPQAGELLDTLKPDVRLTFVDRQGDEVVVRWEIREENPDPATFQVPPDNVQNVAERGYKLLEAMSRIPGHDDLGQLQSDRLAKWVGSVRQASAEYCFDRPASNRNCCWIRGRNLSGRKGLFLGRDGVLACTDEDGSV